MAFRTFGSLLCGALLLVATAAFAGDPLPGIDVSMEQNPGGIIIASTTTSGTGDFTFKSVPPGSYLVKVASGRLKGTIIKTVTLTKAGPVAGKAEAPSTAPAAR